MKQKISVWELLVWTYRNQSTRYMIDHQASDKRGFGSVSMTQRAIGTAQQGCIVIDSSSVGYKVHDDAYLVHNIVAGLPDRYPNEYWSIIQDLKNRVILGAELDLLPDWFVEREPLKILPVITNPITNRPECVWKNGYRFLCLLKYEGHTSKEIERLNLEAKDEYDNFYNFLKSLETCFVENEFKMFNVQGLGVESKPWLLNHDVSLNVAA